MHKKRNASYKRSKETIDLKEKLKESLYFAVE
jgi:hypothetical protein